MLVGELERVHQTESLIDRAADGEIVHSRLAENTLVIDDEETAESDTLILQEDSEIARDLLGDIRQDRNAHGAKTTALLVLLSPRQVAVLGVNTGSDHLDTKLTEHKARTKEIDEKTCERGWAQPLCCWEIGLLSARIVVACGYSVCMRMRLTFLNSSILSEKARISVGQTN
jgi:hypothetical protein